MSKATPEQQIIFAHHEAGHAVVARVLGVGVSYASLHPVETENRANVVTASASWLVNERDIHSKIAALEKDAKVAFGGALAQTRYHPLTEKQFHRAIKSEWTVDWKNASTYVRIIIMLKNTGKIDDEMTFDAAYTREATALAERLLNETDMLVFENWQAIERVATALLSKPFLTQVDIDALVTGRPNLDDLINRPQQHLAGLPFSGSS